jgi:hypothetical protein
MLPKAMLRPERRELLLPYAVADQLVPGTAWTVKVAGCMSE